jgi:hypothetical protein
MNSNFYKPFLSLSNTKSCDSTVEQKKHEIFSLIILKYRCEATILWIVAFFFLTNNAFGQENFMAFEEAYKPLVVFIFPAQYRSEVLKSIAELKLNQHNRYHYYLMGDSLHSKQLIVKKINDLLNNASLIDK